MSIATLVFLFLIVLAIFWNRFWPYDPSIGETHPKITDEATYPKFYVHAISGFALAMLMHHAGVPLLWIGILMFIATIGYEWSQRFINALDILAGLFGALIAYFLWRI